MPPLLQRSTRFRYFLRHLRGQENALIVACQPALDFYDDGTWEDRTFGEAIDVLPLAAGPRTGEYASWGLCTFRQYFAPDVRASFLAFIDDPMTAYRMLKVAARQHPAGDDWTDPEREVLRQVFRGKLPNVDDAEII
jgi:hypothetical protein